MTECDEDYEDQIVEFGLVLANQSFAPLDLGIQQTGS
jgi:hypothetical protein